jgi:hypothetical protein
MRRLLLAGAVLAFPIGALTLGVSGVASASTGTHPAAKATPFDCTKIKANETSTKAKLKGCGDTKNTGGSGSTPVADFATGMGTITWDGTGTSTYDNGTFMATSTNSCPSGSTEYEVMADISGGTGAAAKSIPDTFTFQAFVCVNNTTGKVTLLAGTDVEFGPTY